MKTYILITMFAFSVFGINSAAAQTTENIQKVEQSIKKNGKYAVLVMNPNHLKAAIMTGQDFKSRSARIDFQIVTCGPMVKQISEDKELQKIISEAVKIDKLKILVCGLSIKQFDVDSSLLPSETPLTENGLIYMFGLQERGYKTIIL